MTFEANRLISQKVANAMPSQFQIRPLKVDDWSKGFLTCLEELTIVGGKMTKQAFVEQFSKLSASGKYFICVIEDLKAEKIAAAGTLFVEDKFIHANGKVGHIEDIVVGKAWRGMNFGKFIIEQLKHVGKTVGCYKVILDCSEKNVPFYEKCGFTVKEKQMVVYFEENDAAKMPLSRL